MALLLLGRILRLYCAMTDESTSPAQSDPCGCCGSKLDRYTLCPCIESPCLGMGSPVKGEIFDVADASYSERAMAAQVEDWHHVHPSVAIRIRDIDPYGESEDPTFVPAFGFAEVSPETAIRFAFRIFKVAAHAKALAIRNIISEKVRR